MARLISLVAVCGAAPRHCSAPCYPPQVRPARNAAESTNAATAAREIRRAILTSFQAESRAPLSCRQKKARRLE